MTRVKDLGAEKTVEVYPDSWEFIHIIQRLND